ncbi:hypothetical protein D3C86_1573070 [compost metagenome]
MLQLLHCLDMSCCMFQDVGQDLLLSVQVFIFDDLSRRYTLLRQEIIGYYNRLWMMLQELFRELLHPLKIFSETDFGCFCLQAGT